MSILKSIFDKVFHRANADTPPYAQTRPSPSANAATPNPTQAQPAPSSNAATPSSTQAQPAGVTDPGVMVSPGADTFTQSNAQISETDVEQVLNDLAAKSGEPSNWRTSIVDLLKLLGLDSSLQSRKELARELNYSGDMNDSASMNIWLHKQVMNKLAANGGKVPADLKD